MRTSGAILLSACLVASWPARAELPPAWIGAPQLAALARMGVDPAADVEVKGNYHWRWRARRVLSIGGYLCPIGSAVDISRSITLISPPVNGPCKGSKRKAATALKILPDGSAEPLEP